MAEAEQSLAVIRAEALRPASNEEIARILAARFALYPQPVRTDAEWAAWWADYTNALDDLPPSAIEAGMAAYVKGADSEFFPKPGRIRELARTVPNKIARACQIAEWAVRRAASKAAADTDPPEPTHQPSDAEKASVRSMLESFARQMAEKAPAPKPTRPPTSGPVDETGLTQLMRDHMASQRP